MRRNPLFTIALACGLTVTACSGGGTSITVGGQTVNGTDDAVTVASEALDDFASQVGANVEKAQCHLRLAEYGGDSDDQIPQSVDCLPVGFLGTSGLNAVSFNVRVEPDPQRPKDLVAAVDTESPTVIIFNAGTDIFRPDLPETLPQAGEASVPAGYALIGDQLVKSADLESATAQAIDAMRLDPTHDASVKFTLADEPTCLFEANLQSMWCGPGVSLTKPEGEVYNASLAVARLDVNTYQQVGSDEPEITIGEFGNWQPVGSEPGSLIDASGQVATLPSIDTIEAPEIPQLDPGYFAEIAVENNVWVDPKCLPTDRAAPLCDANASRHIEANPTTLVFTSGSLTVNHLTFGEQTGLDQWSSPVDAERAADGERLVAIDVTLERNEDVADTTPLNAQILVDGQVKGDFGNASGHKLFFMSVPLDATVTVVLQSDGEDQSLDIKGDTIERSTDRPELYLERASYTFSADQRWDDKGTSRQVAVTTLDGASTTIKTVRWIVNDKKAVVPPKGSRFLYLTVSLGVSKATDAPTDTCSISLVLADGTTIDPTPIRKSPCVTASNYRVEPVVAFAIPVDADIKELRIHPFTVADYDFPELSIPTI